MPPLNNQRHEKYCQALFEGQPQNAAYEAAGYRYHEGNASRLRSNEKVIARLTELQAAAAKASECTVESLLQELEDARQHANSLGQLSAVVKAIGEKAKISGLLTTKIEVKDTTNEPDHNSSMEDIASWFAMNHNDMGVVLTEEQRVEFGGILESWARTIRDYLDNAAASNAKPVQSVFDRQKQQQIERKRLGLAHGNGS